MKNKRKGQGIVEYVLLGGLCVVVAISALAAAGYSINVHGIHPPSSKTNYKKLTMVQPDGSEKIFIGVSPWRDNTGIWHYNKKNGEQYSFHGTASCIPITAAQYASLSIELESLTLPAEKAP